MQSEGAAQSSILMILRLPLLRRVSNTCRAASFFSEYPGQPGFFHSFLHFFSTGGIQPHTLHPFPVSRTGKCIFSHHLFLFQRFARTGNDISAGKASRQCQQTFSRSLRTALNPARVPVTIASVWPTMGPAFSPAQKRLGRSFT